MLNFKKLIISAMLASCICATASAEIYPASVTQALENPNINSAWPYTTVCSAEDVNLRTQPNTNCDVITMLQRGDKFYVSNVIPGNEYTWMEGITTNGDHGYMVSKYLESGENAALRRERFRAAIQSSMIYNHLKFANIVDLPVGKNIEKLKEEKFGYAPQIIRVGNSEFHGEQEGDNFHVIGVILKDSNYKFAGLKLGDPVTGATLKAIDKDMQTINWYSGYEDTTNWSNVKEVYWYRHEAVDGSERPVEKIGIITENGRIKEIRWAHIVID